MMKKVFFMMALAGSLFPWGCQPKPNEGELFKEMVVTTDYNSTANFSNYTTYTLAFDTLGYHLNTDPNSTDTLILGSGASSVTTAVNDKLTAAGYTRVSKKSSPDLYVHIYIYENYSAYQSYYYNPYSYGYYGGYYGGYSSTISVSDQANLFIFIIDLKHQATGKAYVWGCNIGDLVSSPDQTTNTIVRAIDQAFKQSSYIKK